MIVSKFRVAELVQVPTGTSDFNDLISRFAATWRSPLTVSDGYAEEEIARKEAELGIRIPLPLRSFLLLAGNRADLAGTQDPFRSPGDLVVNDVGMLEFRDECQKCATWGTPVTGGDSADGESIVFWLDRQRTGTHWEMYQRRLDLFLLEASIAESMLAVGSISAFVEGSAGLIAALKDAGRPLAFPDHPFWPVPDAPPVRWFGVDDVFLRVEADEWAWLYARTESDMAAAQRTLPVAQWTRV